MRYVVSVEPEIALMAEPSRVDCVMRSIVELDLREAYQRVGGGGYQEVKGEDSNAG